jgi:hypothetical protein
MYSATHEEITASLAPLHGFTMPDANTLQRDTLLTAAQRLVKIYRPLIPALMLISSFAIFPASVRAAFTLLAQGLDALATVVSATAVSSTPVSSTPVAPITASAAADTTTTNPSTDPSFKAGKDL